MRFYAFKGLVLRLKRCRERKRKRGQNMDGLMQLCDIACETSLSNPLPSP